MYCGRCGAEIKDKTARFCDNCGAPLETGGDQNDYGNEYTYNERSNNRNGTYSGINGTYNSRTGQNSRDDNLIWDDGLPEVPDNRGNKGDQKKWFISIGCTAGILVVTVIVLALLLGKNSGGSDSDIVVNITQAPKAEASHSSTKTARADTEEKKNAAVSDQAGTKNSSTQKSVKVATPTPSIASDVQELQITNEQNKQSSSSRKKQLTVQPSQKSIQKSPQSANTQSQQTQQSSSQSEVDKDLEALQNVPVQEYTMPEENTDGGTQSSQNSTAGTTSGSSSTVTAADSGDYIFPESNSAYLTKDQLEGLSKDQLAYARNEIYARHGRRFRDQMFQDYFNAKSWYVPQYDSEQFDAMQDTIFNEYEKANAKLILQVEQEHGYTY